jgi:hypothetical protein
MTSTALGIVFTDRVLTAAVLCTTSVLQFLSLHQMIQEVHPKVSDHSAFFVAILSSAAPTEL